MARLFRHRLERASFVRETGSAAGDRDRAGYRLPICYRVRFE
jgi:hypothetical protein